MPRRISSDIHLPPTNLASVLWRFVPLSPYHGYASLKIFIGYDPEIHMGLFTSLERDDVLGKVTLLHQSQAAADSIAEQANAFTLPRLTLDGIFLSEKPPRAPKKLAPLATGSYISVTSNGGLISPQSPDRSLGRPIDPSLVSQFLVCPTKHVILKSRPFLQSRCTNVSIASLNPTCHISTFPQKTLPLAMNII